MTRYRIEGPWHEDTAQHYEDYEGNRYRIVTETARLVDTQAGWTYEAGAYRVRVVGKGTGLPRARTFRGESAWSAADRYAHECLCTLRMLQEAGQ